uniref:KIF-binding protein n=1 Tax=Parastrongyloides trichosuri TaxID=131310 RepID=A0A0N5A4F9_PARTI
MDINITGFTKDELYCLAYVEPIVITKELSDSDRRKELKCKDKKETERLNNLYELFNDIFSTKTFNDLLVELRYSINVVSTEVNRRLQLITRNLGNMDYRKFVTYDRLIEICPIFSKILKKRLNVYLRLQILIIARYVIAHLRTNHSYPFGSNCLEIEIFNQAKRLQLEIGVGYHNTYMTISFAYYCRMLSFLTIFDNVGNIYDLNLTPNITPMEFVAASLKESTMLWVHTVYRNSIKNTDEFDILNMNIMNCYFDIAKTHYNLQASIKNNEYVGDIQSSKIGASFEDIYKYLNQALLNKNIFDSECDPMFNVHVRLSIMMLFMCFQNIFEIIVAKEELVSSLYIYILIYLSYFQHAFKHIIIDIRILLFLYKIQDLYYLNIFGDLVNDYETTRLYSIAQYFSELDKM